MDRHDIDHSVVSLANPWLDWCDKREAQVAAREINAELLQWCTSPASQGRLSFFAVLPSPSVESCVSEIERLAGNDHVKGCILGTRGAGKGLDDRALDPMWAALEKAGWMAFVHPHYHLPTEVYGEQENGHVLYVVTATPKLPDAYIRPLAFGFPVETSLAISRLILAGVMERFPDLKLLIAHSGGVLPFLAGRLDSCVAHDRHVSERLSHPPSVYLSQLYYDAVSCQLSRHQRTSTDPCKPDQPASLQCTKAILGGSSDKLLFGTDHPFFPVRSSTAGSTGTHRRP
jgi:aminocarboxymuconate-semialdehyde decarboxylase